MYMEKKKHIAEVPLFLKHHSSEPSISGVKNEVAFTETMQNHCQGLYEILLHPNNNFELKNLGILQLRKGF